jgi:hypothetical protein
MLAAARQSRVSVAVRENTWRSQIRPILLWMLFATGLAIESLAPRLKIEHRAFVMPITLTASSAPIRPDEIVDRERKMQAAASLLILASSIGLALCYQRKITAALMPNKFSHPPGL